jgi:protein-tyrosine phosphatase
VNIVVLCTGNICRSPMAEVLLARQAAGHGSSATVSSAGFVTEGRAAEPHAIRVMADRGLDLAGHRSRLATEAILAPADLVIAMTREHVREACAVDGSLLPRTFTLKELVRRGSVGGPAHAGLDEWLTVVNEGRVASELLGGHERDDVADPMGRSLRRFRSCADEIDGLSATLADLLWPRGAP